MFSGIIWWQSRNGTYITFSGDIGTKQYLNSSTEQALENNDIISFGFNTASVYDINDKNAFIYRLVKESIETIDLMLSDDDEEAEGDDGGDVPAKADQERPAAPLEPAAAALPPISQLKASSSSSSSSQQQPSAAQGKIISIENKVNLCVNLYNIES